MAKRPAKPLQKSIIKNGRKYNVWIGRNKSGYFAYANRVRSKSYPTIKDIPVKVLKSIESIG